MENKKVCGYIRVSTDLQDASMEVQEKRIKEYCEYKHLQLTEIFIDEGVSGSVPLSKRPGGKSLTEALVNIKAIVVVKPDRLFRSTVDGITTVDLWDKMNIDLHVIDMGGATLNTNTAIGKFVFTLLISQAQFEREITGERIKVVLNNKKATGKTYSYKVMGYDNVGGDLVNGKLVNRVMVKNQEEQEIISMIKTAHSKGYQPTRTAKVLNRFGYRTKTKKEFLPSTIQYILKNQLHN